MARARAARAAALARVLVAAMLLLSARGASGCLSAQIRERMLQHTRRVALSFGMARGAADCVVERGAAFGADALDVDGMRMTCYNHRRFAAHMARALLQCLALGEVDDGGGARLRMDVQRVATLECDCESGCNYCCVLVDIDGEEACFRDMCPLGNGFCDNAHLRGGGGSVRAAGGAAWAWLARAAQRLLRA